MNDTIKGPLNGPTNDEEMLRLVQSGLPPDQLRAEVTRRLVQRAEEQEPEWGALLRAAAIPRRLDEGIVGVLRGAPDDAQGNRTALERLADTSFVLPDPEGRSYALHEEVRAVLLEDWQAPERRARYVKLSRALWKYFARGGETEEFVPFSHLLLESLYHHFAFDPAGAFAEFEWRFTNADQFYRRAECGALLAAAEEQKRGLDEGQRLLLRYYRARLALVLDRWAEAEAGYRELLTEWLPSPRPAATPLPRWGKGTGERGVLKLRTWTLNDLGIALARQSKWAQAMEVYQETLKGWRELGDRYNEGLTLNNLGLVYRAQGHWEQAIECYEASLRICRELGDRHGEGQILTNLGSVYEAQGRWDQAIECYQESLRICRELGNRHGENQTLTNLDRARRATVPEPGAQGKLTSRFEDALVYASNLHSRQTRKASDIPYIAHLLSVAALVIEDGGDEDEAIAALLHDAIEDQGGQTTREEIRRRFGERVRAIVDGCTDAETLPKPPWRPRKERFIKSLSQAPPEVRRVTAADTLHNARSTLLDFRRYGEAIWERFNGGKEGTLWYYREVTEVLREKHIGPLVEELDKVVRELENLPPSTGIRFDEELGALLIHLDKEDIGLSDERIKFHGKIFEPKEEVHITVIGKGLGRQLKQAIEEDSLIESQIRQAIDETDWSYKVKDKMYHVFKDKKKLGPQGDIRIVHAESIISMVEIAGIQRFYEKLGKITQMELEAPPTHITLYTYGDPFGIGLASQADFREFVTREVLPDELKRLSTARGGERKIVLVDMDGVIADFEGGFLKNWREQHPDKPSIPLEHRTTFYIADQYPQEWRELVRQIILAPGFYRNLEPIQGSIAALQEMSELGFEVFICSRPLSEYKNCVLEKYKWVEEHLGEDWVKRIILTRDKTIIRADMLIDDRPEIQGVAIPSWEHIICDQPYNREEKQKRRLSWENWRDIILSDMDV